MMMSSSPPPSSSSTRKRAPLSKEEDRIVVVGGGIAGCACVAELWRRGYRNVLLLEKDETKETRRQGYGLTISETNSAVGKLALHRDLKKKNVKSTQHWTIDARSGDVLGYFGQLFRDYLFSSSSSAAAAAASKSTRKEEEEEGLNNNNNNNNNNNEEKRKGNLRVPRNVVREILLERIPKDNIVWNAEVETIEMVKNRDEGTAATATITLKKNRRRQTNLRIENCALIVAADGSHSTVQKMRQKMYGKEVVPDLKYLGVVLITGFTSLKHYLLNNRGFYAVDGQSRLFTMPFADENKDDDDDDDDDIRGNRNEQKTMWQLSVRCDEDEAKRLYQARTSDNFDRIVQTFVSEKTKRWRGAPIAKMFETTDFSRAWAGPLYDRDEPTKIADDGVIAVIGDASHPMSPFKGQGANTALEDAWLLCEWLDGPKAPKSVSTALKCFHRESFAKAFKKVRQSREACEIYHDPNKVFRFCENEITSLTKAQSEEFCEAMRENRRKYSNLDDDDDNVDIDARALRVCEELGFSKKNNSINNGSGTEKDADDGVVKHYKLKKQKLKKLLDVEE